MRFTRFDMTFCYFRIIMTLFILFGMAERANAAVLDHQTICYYDPGNLQHRIVSDLVRRYNPRLNADNQRLIIAAIFRESTATGIHPFFIAGVIAAESSFRPGAVSPCAAAGLMQLSAGVAKAQRIRNPYDITQNIYAGVQYLRYLKRRFQADELVLAAYNAGPSRVARLRRIPRIGETIRYIRKVSGLYRTMSDQWLTALQELIRQPVLCPLLADLSDQADPEKFASLQCRVVFITPGPNLEMRPSGSQSRFRTALVIFDRRLLLFA